MPLPPTVPDLPDSDAMWQFALAVYDRPGVADTCIALQDEQGADVVLLLGLLWLAEEAGRAAGDADIAALDAALADWRAAAVVPLRDVRRALKPRLAGLPPAAAALRGRIKDAELEAERIAFALLAAAIRGLPPAPVEARRRDAARHAVERYLGRLGAAPGDTLPAPAEALLAALDGAAPPDGSD